MFFYHIFRYQLQGHPHKTYKEIIVFCLVVGKLGRLDIYIYIIYISQNCSILDYDINLLTCYTGTEKENMEKIKS